MSKPPDLVGRKFGRLTVHSYEGAWRVYGMMKRFWNCSCECGGKGVYYTNELTSGRVTHCQSCKSERGVDYIKDYQIYRDKFTPEQQRQYDQIVNGRKGRTVEAEAVDLVMRGMASGLRKEVA